MKYTLTELKIKYIEYKNILQKIENGDKKALSDTTISQYEMMNNIVSTLDDMGFKALEKFMKQPN